MPTLYLLLLFLHLSSPLPFHYNSIILFSFNFYGVLMSFINDNHSCTPNIQHHSSVDFWLSKLPHNYPHQLLPPNSLPSPPTSAPSPSIASLSHLSAEVRKRKRSEENESAVCKRLRPGQPLTRQALRQALRLISGNMGGNSKQHQGQSQVVTRVCILVRSPLTFVTGAYPGTVLHPRKNHHYHHHKQRHFL